MIREIVGVIVTGMVAAIILWFIIPMLNTARIDVVNSIPDPDNMTNIQLVTLSEYIFTGLIFLVVIVSGFVIMMYITRRENFDVGSVV